MMTPLLIGLALIQPAAPAPSGGTLDVTWPGLALAAMMVLVAVALWRSVGDERPAAAWVEVAPGVFRTPGYPHGYALVEGENALLIDAPRGADGLKSAGVKTVESYVPES